MEGEEFFEIGGKEQLEDSEGSKLYFPENDIARLQSKFRLVNERVQELEETLARLSKEQSESIQQLHYNMELAMERNGKNVKEIADERALAKQKLSETRFFDKLEPLHEKIWSIDADIEQTHQEQPTGFVHPEEVTELKAENDELKKNVHMAEQSMCELKDAFEEMQTKFHENQEELRAEREKKQSLQESIFCLHSLIAAMRETNLSQATFISQRKFSQRRRSEQTYSNQDCFKVNCDPLSKYLILKNNNSRHNQSYSNTIDKRRKSYPFATQVQTSPHSSRIESSMKEKCGTTNNTIMIDKSKHIDEKYENTFKFHQSHMKYYTLRRNTKLFSERGALIQTADSLESLSFESYARMMSVGTIPRRRKIARAHNLFLLNGADSVDRFHRNNEEEFPVATSDLCNFESPPDDNFNKCQINRTSNANNDCTYQDLIETEHSIDSHASHDENLLSDSTLDHNSNSDLESELDETHDHRRDHIRNHGNLLATFPDHRTYRVAVAGNTNVGKTSLLMRICSGHNPDMKPRITIGCDFFEKTVRVDNHLTVNLQFFDTAGTEQYRSISRSYFRRADGIILVYDCTNVRSFNDIQLWIDQIEWSTDKREIPITLCANKTDVIMKDDIKSVDINEAEKLATKYTNMEVFEVSAHNGRNVDHVVSRLCLLMREHENRERASILTLKYDFEPEKKTKCFGCFA